MTPCDKLVASFTLANLITIVSTVWNMMVQVLFVVLRLGMYPSETAIVNASHSCQGGTGDVAFPTAATRMALIPFAHYATPPGRALTVTGTLVVMRWRSGRRASAPCGWRR
ncbi:2-hydroxycarboxylate transporter family protein [Methylobacterium sp. E-045]|nr:2-hydroxycarboxylate transporter family protein [Methylobacterium sp. E-045]